MRVNADRHPRGRSAPRRVQAGRRAARSGPCGKGDGRSLQDMVHVGQHLHGAGDHGMEDMVEMFAIAFALSYAILDSACRVRASHGRARLAWLITGSIVVGLGIWALHFISLLCLELPIPMAEDPMTLAVAAVTAVIAAAGSLHHGNHGARGIPAPPRTPGARPRSRRSPSPAR